MMLYQIGDVLGVTRERIRQIEGVALLKVRRRADRAGLELMTFADKGRDDDYADE